MNALTQPLRKQLDRHLPRWFDWVQLTRIDKPVGSYLLLWPTLWALWVAGEGHPDFANVLIFVLGVFLMRSAGCVINDFADRKIDGHVKRTVGRPLATGKITAKEALITFAVLILLAFVLVLFTNQFTVLLSIGGLVLASLYPFMKRHTHLPQVVLGAAFSWAIPMAFAAQSNELPAVVWLLYMANLSWTVAYDTVYAMVDRDDDLKIGVKSTAVLFGDLDIAMVAILKGLVVFALLLAGTQLEMSWPYYLCLAAGAVFLAWQVWSIRSRERDICFAIFRKSHWFGLIIWGGFVAHYLLR
ncbi:4-hydroxybenzoate octaprenyltransferase [Thalassolituus sp. HI0120]|jgi:4-hydroxybenzoate polyprenyltransferase|nr:4-hydroxybenzoate octaprenyltransferase [Thalassolituus sp. HI0120]